jgi:hypothetical protein
MNTPKAPRLHALLPATLFSLLLTSTSGATGSGHSHHETQHRHAHSGHSEAKPSRKSFSAEDLCAASFRFQKGGKLCIQARWITPPKSPGVPPEGKQGELELTFTQNTQPFDLGKLPTLPRVWLMMPEMNHGSMPVRIEALQPGSPPNQLKVKDMIFSMPGFWEIRLSLPPMKNKSKGLDQTALVHIAE